MLKHSQDTKENNFRLYWKAIYDYPGGLQIILYRIENLIVYIVNIKERQITIKPNEAKVIPDIANPINQEEYEIYLLRHLI